MVDAGLEEDAYLGALREGEVAGGIAFEGGADTFRKLLLRLNDYIAVALWGGGIAACFITGDAGVSPAGYCPGTSRPVGAKNTPSRNYWACMTNKWQKYVVPLQQISIHASSAHVNC